MQFMCVVDHIEWFAGAVKLFGLSRLGLDMHLQVLVTAADCRC